MTTAPDDTPSPSPPKPVKLKRRWTRFSLLSLFMFVTFCGVLMAPWLAYLEPYYAEQRILAELQEIKGHMEVEQEARGPWWLRAIANGRYAQRVVRIELFLSSVTDDNLKKIRVFSIKRDNWS